MILWPVKEIVTSHLVWFMGTDMPATMCAHWMGAIKTKSKEKKCEKQLYGWCNWIRKQNLEDTFRESKRNNLPSL